MNVIKVAVSDLLQQLKINRDKHIKEYNEAMIGYREALVEEIRRKLELAEKGQDVDHTLKTVRPNSFEQYYNEAIGMMEWSIETEVELDRADFKQYVQDEWGWKNQFSLTTSMYGK